MTNETDFPSVPNVGHQADERLLHALLLHLHNPQAAEEREQRVQRVLQTLRTPAPVAHPDLPAPAPRPVGRTLRFPVWGLRGVWATAAMVLIVAGLYLLTYSPTPALASINDILGALNRPGDRTYRIQVEPLIPEIQPRVGLNGATLYLRDGRQFLLKRVDPKGGSLFDGFDGRQSWRISGGVLAETRDGLGAGGLGMPATMSETLFADLQPTLERVQADYTIAQFDQATLPSGGAPLRHVLARRNSRTVKGPGTIEIWADSKTGMPRRIVFDQGKFQGHPQPRRLTFDLVNETILPADWFTPATHITGKKDTDR